MRLRLLKLRFFWLVQFWTGGQSPSAGFWRWKWWIRVSKKIQWMSGFMSCMKTFTRFTKSKDTPSILDSLQSMLWEYSRLISKNIIILHRVYLMYRWSIRDNCLQCFQSMNNLIKRPFCRKATKRLDSDTCTTFKSGKIIPF